MKLWGKEGGIGLGDDKMDSTCVTWMSIKAQHDGAHAITN